MASKPSCIEDTSYEPLGHAPINFLISIYDTDNAGVYILLYHPILCSAELQRPWEMNRDVTAPPMQRTRQRKVHQCSPRGKIMVTSQTFARNASEGDCGAALQLSGCVWKLSANQIEAVMQRQITDKVPYSLVEQ